MIAKEMITTNVGMTSTIVLSLLSFLTAFYIIRIALVVYDSVELQRDKNSILENLSMLGLLILNILFYIYLHKTAQYKIAEPFWAALTAWVCVYILYIKNAFWKVPILYHMTYNGFYLDKIYTKFYEKTYLGFANLCNFIDTKIFANYELLVGSSKLGVKTFWFVENRIMNGLVSLVSRSFKKLSLFDYKAQTGNIQSYNIYALIIITIIITSLIFVYSAMLIYFGG